MEYYPFHAQKGLSAGEYVKEQLGKECCLLFNERNMMPISNFRKALRLAEKANIHFFRNGSLNHRPEPVHGYVTENIEVIKKRELQTGHKAHFSKHPKGKLK